MPRKGKRSASQKQRRKLEAVSDASSSTNSVSGMNDAHPYVVSVSASHCQTDCRYNIYSRGRQCTCNSLMFLAVHHERNELSSSDLDNILQKGDAIYTRIKQTLQGKGQFVHNFLSFDELPSTIETNSELYNIVKHPRRFGFLRDTPALGDYESLANTLQCLRSDVSDALLLCGNTCIAVFRDRSGRFGYFDSHCRTIEGMYSDDNTGTALMLTFFSLEDLIERLLLLLQAFFDLGDQEQFDLLPLSLVNTLMESCVHTEHCVTNHEVEMNRQPCVSAENAGLCNNQQSADISQQYVQLQDSVQQLSEKMFTRVISANTNLNEQSKKPNHELERNRQPSVSAENGVLSNNQQSADISEQYVQLQDSVQQPAEKIFPKVTSTKTNLNEQSEKLNKSQKRKAYNENAGLSNNQQFANFSQQYVQLQDSVQQLPEKVFTRVTSTKTNVNEQSKKLSKRQKRKAYNIKWRKDLAHKKHMYEKKQTLHKVYDYKKNNKYRQRHKRAMKNTYWNNIIYREKHKQAMTHKYKNIDEYRERKKRKVTSNYRNSAKIRERQNKYIIQNYRNNKQFRERQKSYINEHYRNDEQFRERQKSYINEHYRDDEQFRERQKSYINEHYRDDEQFRERQKSYINEHYRNDEQFRERQKSYINEHYRDDEQFRERQKSYINEHYRDDEQFRERQKSYINEHYRDDEQFRERQKSYINEHYRDDEQFRERQKSYINEHYRDDEQFRERQKSYINEHYRDDEQFRERQKSYITEHYRDDEQFRERQKSYINEHYRDDEQFRERQKSYINDHYRDNEQFRERQKNYINQKYRSNAKFNEQHRRHIVERYLKDPIFKQRKKDYYTNRCRKDFEFYEKRKSNLNHRYHNDIQFRTRKKMYYLFKVKKKRSALNAISKIQCAQHIQGKYRKMYLIRLQRNMLQDSQSDIIQDPGVLRALNTFREVVKQGPTYVCTCCARALFSNQVRVCDRGQQCLQFA